jgi:predicted TPR repeat methyltransferase
MSTSDTEETAKSGVSLEEAFETAQQAHVQGHVTFAREVYRRILSAAPEHSTTLHFLGLAEFQLGNADEAIRLMEAALRVDPGYADAHVNLGNVLKRTGDLESARGHYEQAIELAPASPDALNNLGTIFRAERWLTKALPLFDRALELAPDHFEAHHNRGNVLLAMGRDDEALGAYQQALMLRPYDRNSYRQLGAALYATNRVKEAADVYRRWSEIAPDDPEAKHLLAACSGEGVPPRASNEVVKLLFDNFAGSFDAVLERLQYRAPEHVAETVRALLGEPAADRDVLDAGCGTGLGGPLLRPYARRLAGLDLSERMIESATKRGVYHEFFVGDLTLHLEQHPAEYDVVASIDTLCYFGDLEPVAAGLHSALRPSGVVVFSVERAEEDAAPAGFRLNPHGRYSHTEAYVRRTLEGSLLDVVSLREVVLRKEAGKPVNGFVVAARRQAA